MSEPPGPRETPKPERTRRDFFRTLVGRGPERPAAPAPSDEAPVTPPPEATPKSRRNPRPSAIPPVRE
jgi:hypothetical protein